jgi:MFS transporter, ACS family, aldohexuronate transporter
MSRDRMGWPLALAATFTMAISYVDRQTLAVLAPTVTKALGISDQAYGWIASSFSIAYLVGAPLAGRLIDLLGARRGLLGAVLTWSIVAALHALVPGFAVLFALRIALGLAEAPSFPGAAQTVSRALPPEAQARGFGLLFVGSSLGSMLAPPLAVGLAGWLGWRAAFIGVAIVGLSWIPVWLALAFSPRGREILDRPAERASEAASWGEWLRLWAHPAVLRAVVAVLATAPTVSFVLLWGAKYLVRERGLQQADVGKILWIPPLLWDAGSLLFGHLASERAARRADGSPPRLLFGAAAVMTTAIAAMPLAPSALTAVLVAGVALGGGAGCFALLTADMLARVPARLVSTAGGLVAAAQSLAYIVANPLVGASVERHAGYSQILWQLGLWVIPGCAAWIAWRPPPVERPPV